MSGSPDLGTSEFPPASAQQWREQIAALLRGRGRASGPEPDTALRHRTYDGIEIRALYTAADLGEVAAVRPGVGAEHTGGERTGGWEVRARHADPDPARSNAAIRSDLAGGVNALWLVLGDAGLALANLPDALADVDLDSVPLILDAADQTEAAAAALGELARQREAGALSGSLGADPFGHGARTGAAVDLDVLSRLAAGGSGLRVATVDATVYHDAGASDAQEIGIATAVGVAYLRVLTEAGQDIDQALDSLEFRFSITDDQFAGVAKLRAARRIWARVAQLCGSAHGVQRQHAVTSAAMLTQRDPWANMLRGTVACAAAAIGGADAISVLPFDHALGLPDELARRIARNTSAILQDESALARVADAVGGSWYVESRSDALAQQAWATFTSIEGGEGGARGALESGLIADLIADTRQRRAADIAHRRAPITGVSEYAVPDEQLLSREPAPVPPAGGLPRVRYAAGFEALRARADDWTNSSGQRPRVLLAALGGAEHGQAASFAANLFRAGGIEAVTATGTGDELVGAVQAGALAVACLVGAEAVPLESAAAEAAGLKAAGVRLLWLVGEPGALLGPDPAAGVDGYLYSGCDALEVLRRTLDAIGAA